MLGKGPTDGRPKSQTLSVINNIQENGKFAVCGEFTEVWNPNFHFYT